MASPATEPTPDEVPDEPLARAQRALAAGALDESLAALLEAWRRSPAPQLADWIDRVDALAEPGRSGTADWVAAARGQQPRELRALLDRLDEGTFTQTLERLSLLASWPPDPRLTPALIELIAEPRSHGLRYRRVLAEAAQQLAALGDPRLASLAPQHLPTLLGGPPRQVLQDAVADALLRPPPRPPAGAEGFEQALLAAEDAGQRAPLATLLERVLAAPADDGPRRVYADALMERGDAARGELIMLQLRAAGKLDAAARKREKALLAEHAARWLGRVGVAIKADFRFERGFLDRCELKGSGHHPASEARVRASVGDPRWNTVRSLAVPTWGGMFELLLDDPAMRSLTELRGVHAHELGRLGEVCGQLTSLELIPTQGPLLAALWRLALPRIERLAIRSRRWRPHLERARELFDTPPGQRLRELELDGDPTDLRLWLMAAESAPQLGCLRLIASPWTLTATRHGGPWTLELAKARASGEVTLGRLLEAIRVCGPLAALVARVPRSLPASDRQRIEQLAATRGLPLRWR